MRVWLHNYSSTKRKFKRWSKKFVRLRLKTWSSFSKFNNFKTNSALLSSNCWIVRTRLLLKMIYLGRNNLNLIKRNHFCKSKFKFYKVSSKVSQFSIKKKKLGMKKWWWRCKWTFSKANKQFKFRKKLFKNLSN